MQRKEKIDRKLDMDNLGPHHGARVNAGVGLAPLNGGNGRCLRTSSVNGAGDANSGGAMPYGSCRRVERSRAGAT